MTLSGFDIANVNGSGAYSRASSGSFLILKASEGTGFRDGYHDGWASQARAAGKLVGHYHYAHLTNSPTAEADWFLSCAKAQPGEVLVLDFEPYGQPVSDASFPAWAVAFLQRVNAATKASCWIYLNDDMAGRITRNATPAQLAVLHAAPLWKARYRTSNAGSLFGWPTVTAWQWNDTPLDLDTFYGDASTWHALGVGGNHPTAAPPSAPTRGLTLADINSLTAQLNALTAQLTKVQADADVIRWGTTDDKAGIRTEVAVIKAMLVNLAAASGHDVTLSDAQVAELAAATAAEVAATKPAGA